MTDTTALPSTTMDLDLPPPPSSKSKATSKSKKRSASRDPPSIDDDDDDDEEEDDNEKELINIDFEFFDPQPHDFHGIKLLLRQLFDADAHLLDLSALTDLILEQKLVGSTVKVDGKEGDPFSFVSVVNLRLSHDNPGVKSLISYITDRAAAASTPLHDALKPHISTPQSSSLGIILSERLINMPPDVSPPAYKMLLEEIGYAVEDNEPYEFTHYLIISKVYQEVESSIPPQSPPLRPQKRIKSKTKSKSRRDKKQQQLTFNFHPEDEYFITQAAAEEEEGGVRAVTYKYKHEPPPEAADSKRAFQEAGIATMGRMVLVTKDGFVRAVEGMQP